MLGNKRIAIGNNRRKEPISKNKIFLIISILLLVFLAIWQMPIKQNEVSQKIEPPKPIEVK